MWHRLRSWLRQPTTPSPDAPRETSAHLLRRLHWTVLRPLATSLGGDERSLVRGPGMDLAEIREYQPGDDVRLIDWNVTARTEQPHVREAYAERALDAWLVLDLSASVDWGTAQCLKRDRLTDFVGVAGQLLGRRGHRIGAITFADQPLGMVPPGSGRVHLQRLVEAIRTAEPPQQQGATNLQAALEHTHTLLRRRSVLVVVSDFLMPDGWQPVLGRLAQRHDTVAVRLHDPRESALPDVGMVMFEDPETGTQLMVNTADAKLRERFRVAAAAQAEQLRVDLARCGVDQFAVSTDEALLGALVHFLDARRTRRSVRAQHTFGVRAGSATENRI